MLVMPSPGPSVSVSLSLSIFLSLFLSLSGDGQRKGRIQCRMAMAKAVTALHSSSYLLFGSYVPVLQPETTDARKDHERLSIIRTSTCQQSMSKICTIFGSYNGTETCAISSSSSHTLLSSLTSTLSSGRAICFAVRPASLRVHMDVSLHSGWHF